ncbi:unnamed protein product, partial [Polarella glacialis]
DMVVEFYDIRAAQQVTFAVPGSRPRRPGQPADPARPTVVAGFASATPTAVAGYTSASSEALHHCPPQVVHQGRQAPMTQQGMDAFAKSLAEKSDLLTMLPGQGQGVASQGMASSTPEKKGPTSAGPGKPLREKVRSQDLSKFDICADKIKFGQDSRTTVMVRNIPKVCSREAFVDFLVPCGLEDRYTFFYMPFDKRRNIHCVALMDGRGGHAQKRNRKSSGQDCEHPHQAPATAVQDLAEAAVHSGVKQKDLEALSRLGAHGKSPQNCQRDLISSCFVDLFSPAVSVFKAPYKFLDKDTGDQTTKWHDTHVLYPHDWFVALDKASLTDRLLGTTDDIDSFWKWQKIDNPKFFRNAFYEGLENFEKLVPILVHGDGAQHAEHDSLVAVSFRSLLTTVSVEDSQFLCAGSCKSCKDEETWPVHWKHLAWSFTALARGIHPCEDADGNSWPIGSYRASVAGTPLCPNSGFRAVIWVLAGDMDYLQVDLGLPHQASLDPCAWCRCNKSDTPFNDFRENAKWKNVRRSPADHIANPVTNHLIMTIPGVNFFCFHLDSLHVLDLGVASHAIGNLLWEICVDHLPGNRAVALATLNKKIAEIYIELNVPKSKWIPALTYKHFNKTASTYPNLKHMKGRRIREFVPVALKLAQEFCADDEHTQHRLEVFKSLDTLYNCIDSPGLEFSSETQVSWTYGSESFMGTVAALCQLVVAALRGSGAAAGRVPGAAGRLGCGWCVATLHFARGQVWALILGFAGGAQPLGSLLEPGLRHFATGGPAVQLRRALAIMTSCTRSLRRLQRLTERAKERLTNEGAGARRSEEAEDERSETTSRTALQRRRKKAKGQRTSRLAGGPAGDSSGSDGFATSECLSAAALELAAERTLGGAPVSCVAREIEHLAKMAVGIYEDGLKPGRPNLYVLRPLATSLPPASPAAAAAAAAASGLPTECMMTSTDEILAQSFIVIQAEDAISGMSEAEDAIVLKI